MELHATWTKVGSACGGELGQQLGHKLGQLVKWCRLNDAGLARSRTRALELPLLVAVEIDARAMAERRLSRDSWPEIEDTWDGPIYAETRTKVEEPVLLGHVFPQVIIGDYRVDFILHLEGLDDFGGVVVECDGHDFHNTKEQAAQDKARDRELQASGYKVLRFTGSEIWRDAALSRTARCAGTWAATAITN